MYEDLGANLGEGIDTGTCESGLVLQSQKDTKEGYHCAQETSIVIRRRRTHINTRRGSGCDGCKDKDPRDANVWEVMEDTGHSLCDY